MSCYEIFKKMKLCLLKVIYHFPHCTVLPCNFEAAFSGPPTIPQDLHLSIDISSFNIGDPVMNTGYYMRLMNHLTLH